MTGLRMLAVAKPRGRSMLIRVGDRCRVRGRVGTIKAISQTTPELTSVDVHLDRDPETGHAGWICTSVDELEMP